MKHDSNSHRPVTIVSLAAVAWDFPLIGRTRMLSEAWQASGQNPVFVEAPHSWRSFIKSAINNPSAGPVRTIRPRATYPVRFWGQVGEPLVRADMIRRARSLRRELEQQIDFRSSIALVVSPAWAPWLEQLPFSKVIYDCIDHLSVHAPQKGLLSLFEKWERELIAKSDAAIVTAESLADHVRTIRSELPIAMVRNGVDVERFAGVAHLPAPDDLPGRRPLIGFVGALFEWIDWELIESCVKAHPEITFVCIGPSNQPDAIRRLSALPNISFPGPRAYGDVPRYLAAFDVCWVPFKAISISAAANPIKIYEYLAAGKPVISTAVADTDTFGDLVRVISQASEFSNAITTLVPDKPDRAAARRAFAVQNSWSHRAADIMEFAQSLT